MTSDPKRLTVVGATDLERSLLQAARRERPSHELTARMAAGLGISAAAVTAAAPGVAAAAPVVAAKTTLTAWVSAGALAAAVAAGVVGVRLSSAPAPAGQHKPAAAVVAAPAEETPAVAPPVGAATERRSEKIRRRSAAPAAVPAPAPAPAGDLRDQIALVDAARTAVKAGLTERALVLLRRYEVSYPGGAFRPEALALRIEALDDAGHAAEARALAREFLARYPHSPLADRIGRVARK